MEQFRQKFIEARKRAGISLDDIGQFCGISRSAVSQWELGETMPTLRNVQKVVMLLNTTVGWLLGEHTEYYRHHLRRKMTTQKIPVIDYEMATNWRERSRARRGHPPMRPILTIMPTTKERLGCFALKIKDTSMQPALLRDDLVVIDPKEEPDPGDYIAAHCLVESEVVIRRYMPQQTLPTEAPIINLKALNEDWPDIEISVLNPGQLIGTVVELRRQRPKINATEIVGYRSMNRNRQHLRN